MQVSIIVGNSREEFEKAKRNAKSQGKSLTKMIEAFITTQAQKNISDKKRYIHESDILKELWCPSRSTLYTLRTNGELREGVHYMVKDGLVFYFYLRAKRFFLDNYPHVAEMNEKKNGRPVGEIIDTASIIETSQKPAKTKKVRRNNAEKENKESS